MKVIGIHGIGNRFEGAVKQNEAWLPSLNSGLREAKYPEIEEKDFDSVFYGSVFRPKGKRGVGNDPISEDDEETIELLQAWWTEAAKLSRDNRQDNDEWEDPRIQSPDLKGRAVPNIVQSCLRALSRTRYFSRAPGNLVLMAVSEVKKYLRNPDIRKQILERVEQTVTEETEVIIGHSLGSVVAYEALCEHPEWNVHTLVTLGSPLGVRRVVFDRLTPAPEDGKGRWPYVRRWVNIADKGDIVALEKKLKPLFTGVQDEPVYNGWRSHNVLRYLTAEVTGRAVGDSLYRIDG